MQKGKKFLSEGILLTEERKWKKAIEKLESALEILENAGNQEILALCRSFLGMAYRADYRNDDALDQFQKFLTLITEMKDMFGIAQGLLDIGLTLSLKKQYDAALDYLNKCLKIIIQDLKDRDLEARALVNLGGVYLLKQDFEAAAEAYQKAVRIADEFDFVEGSAEGYKGLAEISEKKGNLKQAKEQYQKSLGLFRILQDKMEESNIFLHLGVIHSEQIKYDDALFYFTHALKVKKQLGDTVGAKLCEKNLITLQEKIKAKKIKK
ncbi:MAG TPA: tetratricopeptide repeat protein [Candidatus Deferrimicrobium sp.]|nr:tetratricopeptide repeat protein [Candidatus Deferrimicrobium sp.]